MILSAIDSTDIFTSIIIADLLKYYIYYYLEIYRLLEPPYDFNKLIRKHIYYYIRL